MQIEKRLSETEYAINQTAGKCLRSQTPQFSKYNKKKSLNEVNSFIPQKNDRIRIFYDTQNKIVQINIIFINFKIFPGREM